MYLILTHGKLNLIWVYKIGTVLTFILIVFIFELKDQWHIVLLLYPSVFFQVF